MVGQLLLITIANVADKQEVRWARCGPLHEDAPRICSRLAWFLPIFSLRGLPTTTIAQTLQPVDVLGGHGHNRSTIVWRRTNATQISLQILTSAAKVASADVRQ
ncbi:hypothetical protein WH367_19610 [Comamonas sp. MYb21]|uniref:hypothetical protein n=1 Tax=Comamonas sp. MYb21 TaxID=1848648 RepID=UPI0030B6CD75